MKQAVESDIATAVRATMPSPERNAKSTEVEAVSARPSVRRHPSWA
jgi:hypothetical protein